MRVTVDLDEALVAQLTERSARTGRTMSDLLEDAVRAMLATATAAGTRQRIVLPTSGSGGTLPGVDLNDSAALLDLEEDRT